MKLHIKAHTRKLTELINRYRELQFIQKRNEEDRVQMLIKIANKENDSKQSLNSNPSVVNIAAQYAFGKNSKTICLEEAERRNTELLKIKEMAKELDDLCRLISETIFSKSMDIDNFADELIDTEANMSLANTELETTLRRKIARKKFWRWVLFVCLCILSIYLLYRCINDGWFKS
jgi:syntaxin 1B/2/3